jgi:hypothetical protein
MERLFKLRHLYLEISSITLIFKAFLGAKKPASFREAGDEQRGA